MATMMELSRELSDTVRRAGGYTVQVDARGGYPASGIVVEAGAILTADHVVERGEDIAVGLPDGRRLAARLVGRDPASDFAPLSVGEARMLQPSRLESPFNRLGRAKEPYRGDQ